MELKTGDIFLSANSWIIGRAILAVEKFWSTDDSAQYGHGGLIISPQGDTFEALWRTKQNHLDFYLGRKVMIVRPELTMSQTEIPSGAKVTALEELMLMHAGDVYPVHRLILHLLPPLAKIFSSGRFVVCTELVAKYLSRIGCRHNNWEGATPDMLADECRNYRNYRVIYEGVWDGIDKI